MPLSGWMRARARRRHLRYCKACKTDLWPTCSFMRPRTKLDFHLINNIYIYIYIFKGIYFTTGHICFFQGTKTQMEDEISERPWLQKRKPSLRGGRSIVHKRWQNDPPVSEGVDILGANRTNARRCLHQLEQCRTSQEGPATCIRSLATETSRCFPPEAFHYPPPDQHESSQDPFGRLGSIYRRLLGASMLV